MEWILLVLVIYILIDVYQRFKKSNANVRFLNFKIAVLEAVLLNKTFTKEEYSEARQHTIDNMYVGDYEKVKKDMLSLGIDIDKK